MAYTPATLCLLAAAAGPLGRKLWTYDTVDAHGDIDASGYFSDAGERGMEVGDLVWVIQWPTSVPATTAAKNAATITDSQWMMVKSISAGAATTAAETAIVVA